MKLNKERFNWYGLDHDKVRKHFGDLDGNLEYLGTFCLGNEYTPFAVYYSPNPDRAKGHKNYVLFRKDPVLLTMWVSGMDESQIAKYRYQDGVVCPSCPSCQDVIYSVMRHDYRKCSCELTFIDGGRDYSRVGLAGIPVRIDLFKGEISDI